MPKFFTQKDSKSSKNPQESLVKENLLRPAALKDEIFGTEDWPVLYKLCKQRQTEAQDIEQPWQLLAFGGSIAKIKQYFSAHSNYLNSRHPSGRTALHFAAWGGNLDAVQYFREQGYKPLATETCDNPVLYAALSGNPDVLNYLINNGVGDKNTLSTSTGEGLAHYAVQSENMEMVAAVANLGVDFNTKSSAGSSALELAKRLGLAEKVNKVLSGDAGPDRPCIIM